MATYQLTNKAENELEGIYEYSILNFGLKTAQGYLSGLHACFLMLADNQSWGSDYGFIKPHYTDTNTAHMLSITNRQNTVFWLSAF